MFRHPPDLACGRDCRHGSFSEVGTRDGEVYGRNHFTRSALANDHLEEGNVMHLSNQGLLVIIIVGIVAGWLAGRVMEGGGFGLIGDLLVGLVGAFIGDWLLPRLGIHLGVGIVALILNAFIGAVVLLLILRLVGGGWGRRRRWG
jgi:uncharacterized membrane protein YeaQ/YmgE (transglycosylase-associated protein family)